MGNMDGNGGRDGVAEVQHRRAGQRKASTGGPILSTPRLKRPTTRRASWLSSGMPTLSWCNGTTT